MTFEILTRSPALHLINGVFRLSFRERKMELPFGYGVFRGEFKLRFRITWRVSRAKNKCVSVDRIG